MCTKEDVHLSGAHCTWYNSHLKKSADYTHKKNVIYMVTPNFHCSKINWVELPLVHHLYHLMGSHSSMQSWILGPWKVVSRIAPLSKGHYLVIN
jgi:hypothetical protein